MNAHEENARLKALLIDVLTVFGPAKRLTDRDVVRLSNRYPDENDRPMDSWTQDVRRKLIASIEKELLGGVKT